MLFCRMFKLTPDIAAVVMMATEVMHSASPAHDDIEDRDAVRWGRPTIQSLFGLEQAINVGDAGHCRKSRVNYRATFTVSILDLPTNVCGGSGTRACFQHLSSLNV
jgi:geranylgeranyl diphosphate synthase type II